MVSTNLLAQHSVLYNDVILHIFEIQPNAGCYANSFFQRKIELILHIFPTSLQWKINVLQEKILITSVSVSPMWKVSTLDLLEGFNIEKCGSEDKDVK